MIVVGDRESTESTTRSASTPKGERRRQALVDSAAELLAEGGFDAIRHRAVAERAGLPLAATTYYFSSLDDLVSAAVEKEGQEELSAVRAQLQELEEQSTLSTETLVELILDLLLGRRSQDGDAQTVVLRYEGLVGSPRRPYLAPQLRDMARALKGLIGEVLARSGRDADADEVQEIMALADGAVVNALSEMDPEPRAVARRRLLARLG